MQGVLITHQMVLSAIAALVALVEQAPGVEKLDHNDSYFSYLPLAHVFGERAVCLMFISLLL